MGVLRPDNGDASPPDDGGSQPGGLPDLPPEWGAIVIPDDLTELDREAEQIRAELRRETRRTRVRRVLGLPPTPSGRGTGLGTPIAIMAVAVFTTLISLFVVTWDRRPTPPTSANGVGESGRVLTRSHAARMLTDVTLASPAGAPVRLGTLLPAVIMLVDGCACVDLVRRTAEVVPDGVSVVMVGRTAPALTGAPDGVSALADPDGLLSKEFAPTSGGIPGRPAVLFVTSDGEVAMTLPAASSVEEITAALTVLGPP